MTDNAGWLITRGDADSLAISGPAQLLGRCARRLDVDARFGIVLRRPPVTDEIAAAPDRIQRNGTYDQANSGFLPLGGS